MQLDMRLMQFLSDGRFHSGEELGRSLGVSRAAIWKQLEGLRATGIELSAVRGKGYRLPQPLELLDPATIQSFISSDASAALECLTIHPQLDSTNSFLQHERWPEASSALVCLAEQQLAGRGRRGRSWVSPFARNLYLSLAWRFSEGISAMGGLSLVAGIALMRTLRSVGVNSAGLKWPNDILCGNRKLAGILVELAGEASGPTRAIIGIGINVNMTPAAGEQIDQPWTDLAQELDGQNISRNLLAARLIENLLEVLQRFQTNGLAGFMYEWRRYDLTYSQVVALKMPNREVQGIAKGIDETGALLLEVEGHQQRYASGEISLRITT